MVSTHQSNTAGTQYENEYQKLVRKPDQVLKGIIGGLQSVEDCQRLATAEANDRARGDVIARINQRQNTLENRGDTDE